MKIFYVIFHLSLTAMPMISWSIVGVNPDVNQIVIGSLVSANGFFQGLVCMYQIKRER